MESKKSVKDSDIGERLVFSGAQIIASKSPKTIQEPFQEEKLAHNTIRKNTDFDIKWSHKEKNNDER